MWIVVWRQIVLWGDSWEEEGLWFSSKMGVMSRRVVPVCGNLCCYVCPALRASSRQPVKRYKKLLADIFPRNQVRFSAYLLHFISDISFLCYIFELQTYLALWFATLHSIWYLGVVGGLQTFIVKINDHKTDNYVFDSTDQGTGIWEIAWVLLILVIICEYRWGCF